MTRTLPSTRLPRAARLPSLRSLRGRALASPLLVVLALLASAPALTAQEDDGAWETEAELGGAIFFGNTSQTTFTTRAGTETADSAREFSVEGRFSYGQATDEDGEDFVSQRSWKVDSSLDYRPFERWSPFVFGGVESAYERRIDFRYNFGIGAKYLLVRSDRGSVDFSAALLGEETNPTPGSVNEKFNDDLRARWSIRTRASRNWAEERLEFESEAFYRTYFDRWKDFTISVQSSLGFRLNDTISLKLSFIDNYDSEAMARGARTNNDGQVFLTLLSSF